ncbi:hypothetical protein OIDMADRAFT_48657 [Oidiodendron maius Zn]|uniref:Sodium/calcium exchanger membrane region domain-containing protein n=1 Tax=Oidiodendron maius (strain Zn) TaxID=913774 RepID=A0A0C3HKQ0_OIDMZ|nr:hypothetical protein OIDMADRAFT_48657 [Oidiodendron maius Zn]
MDWDSICFNASAFVTAIFLLEFGAFAVAVVSVLQLVLGFTALSTSGYVLSHSVASIADTLYLLSTVLGITVLSFATPLPEKFVAVIGGACG